MNYIIAALVLAVWIFVAMSFSWNPSKSLAVNLFAGFFAILILFMVHWLPFWLIFMK